MPADDVTGQLDRISDLIGTRNEARAVSPDLLPPHLLAVLRSADAAATSRLADRVPALLAALNAVRALHHRAGKPVRCYGQEGRCEVHRRPSGELGTVRGASERARSVRDCPDCTYREVWYCTGCEHEEWPCPTERAIRSALTGAEACRGA